MKINNTKLDIIRGNLTEIEADAIVCPINNELVMYSGLASILKKKGGESIQEEAHKKSPIDIGDVISTSGGNLKVKYIILAAVNKMEENPDEHGIRSVCMNSLALADELQLKSIIMPAMGCGVGGFPAVGSAKIMSQEILKHCRYKNTSLEEIMVCLLDEENFNTFENTIKGYITHIQDNLGNGPYVTVDIIIEIDDGIVIIERSNPPYGYALPGGFLDYGESLEDAAVREAKEETNLDLEDLKQFHTYSKFGRDPRFQTVSTVFIAKGKGALHSGDDAKGLKIIPYDELMQYEYAFDHKEIIKSYLENKG